MAVDPTRPGNPEDRQRVDLDDPDELQYWAQRFNATVDDLKDAVRMVGNDPRAVGDFVCSYLAKPADAALIRPRSE